MTITKCDQCGFELERGQGVRATSYGDTGIIVIPRYKGSRSKIGDNEKHFCSGECLIRAYDYLGCVPAAKARKDREIEPVVADA